MTTSTIKVHPKAQLQWNKNISGEEKSLPFNPATQLSNDNNQQINIEVLLHQVESNYRDMVNLIPTLASLITKTSTNFCKLVA